MDTAYPDTAYPDTALPDAARADAAAPDGAGPPSWWDPDWTRRRCLTVVQPPAEDLVDFPLLVTLTPQRMSYAFAQVTGADLRVVEEDGSVLPIEIETWVLYGTSLLWVRVPLLRAGEVGQRLCLYYGNFSPSLPPMPSGAWDSHFAAVWHLDEIGVGQIDEYQDSGQHGQHGQGGGGEWAYLPTYATGQLGSAQDFDGDDDFIQAPASGSLDITGPEITLEAWVWPEQNPTYNYWGMISKEGFQTGYRLLVFEDFRLVFQLGNEAAFYSLTSLPSGRWTYVVATHDGTFSRLYIDGVLDRSTISLSGNVAHAVEPVLIGHGSNCVDLEWCYGFRGLLDEVRVSSVARSEGWITYQHLSMTDAVLTYGPEEQH